MSFTCSEGNFRWFRRAVECWRFGGKNFGVELEMEMDLDHLQLEMKCRLEARNRVDMLGKV
jgi:hypothetical protein